MGFICIDKSLCSNGRGIFVIETEVKKRVNIYHVTHSPQAGIAHLHFWGCNLNCRGCILKKGIHEYHLAATKEEISVTAGKEPQPPEQFLNLEEVIKLLKGRKVEQVVLMGAEPATDEDLPLLTAALHQEFSCHITLLTNGMKMADISHIDEVVFSIKALNDNLHRDYTGKSNVQALENFVWYYRSGIKMRAESILIPEYIDAPEIENIASFISVVDRSIPYRLDAYIPFGGNAWRRPTETEMRRAIESARKYLDDVSCLTGSEKLSTEIIRLV